MGSLEPQNSHTRVPRVESTSYERGMVVGTEPLIRDCTHEDSGPLHLGMGMTSAENLPFRVSILLVVGHLRGEFVVVTVREN